MDFQEFVRRETDRVHDYLIDNVKKDLGPMWYWLPNKSLSYDPNILSKQESLLLPSDQKTL